MAQSQSYSQVQRGCSRGGAKSLNPWQLLRESIDQAVSPKMPTKPAQGIDSADQASAAGLFTK